MKTKYLIIASFLMISLNTFSQKTGDFDLWDGNHDGKLEKEEYNLNTKIFDDWDKGKDNRISQEEFQKGLFGIFDSNGDEIDNKEWSNARIILNTELDTTNKKVYYFEAFDSDKNGELNKAEFINIAVDVFNTWDANDDNYISKSEFVENSFNWWDQNRNSIIEKEEFSRFRDLRDNQSFWQKIF